MTLLVIFGFIKLCVTRRALAVCAMKGLITWS
jgi:hypothetical protein